ncbi:MAG: hypothetical protein KKG60_03570 [Nanoarchaeota archaeon]|nr:hypothetical protein [Nanoarchaeota archaeon]
MNEKQQLQKNILDLKYQFESQKINAILIICSVGILAFIGTFIWYKNRLFFGIGISIIIILISVLSFHKTKKNMGKILDEISNL